MMWKESYRLGVEHIDAQHKELFDRTHKLLHFVNSDDFSKRKQECIDAISFLKNYAVKHFADEEEYQRSVNYIDIESHKAIHSGFVESVLESEKKLTESDFSLESVKDFCGFLTAWLIYHVADADQKIKTGEKISCANTSVSSFYATCFAHSIGNVLETMLGHSAGNVSFSIEPEAGHDGVVVQIGIEGSFEGSAFFIFPKDTVFAFTRAITLMEAAEIDGIAYSLLSEIANIVSGNAATLVYESGRKCGIAAPKLLSDTNMIDFKNGFNINTEYGKIEVYVNI